jgi:hypothetical protein
LLVLSFSGPLFAIVLKNPGRRKCESCVSSDDVIAARTSELTLSASNDFLPFYIQNIQVTRKRKIQTKK